MKKLFLFLLLFSFGFSQVRSINGSLVNSQRFVWDTTGTPNIFKITTATTGVHTIWFPYQRFALTGGSGAVGNADSLGSVPASGYVRTTRTLTINGSTQDLSANRTWSVGTIVANDTDISRLYTTALLNAKLNTADSAKAIAGYGWTPTYSGHSFTGVTDSSIFLNKAGIQVIDGSKLFLGQQRFDSSKYMYSINFQNTIALKYLDTIVFTMTRPNSTMLGKRAGNPYGMTGDYNDGFGTQALSKITSGQKNVAGGSDALGNLTSGSYNVFTGHASGASLQDGDRNAIVGWGALYNNFSGDDNCLVGASAFYNNFSSQNIGMGTETGFNNPGFGNIFFGYRTGYNNYNSKQFEVAFDGVTNLPLLSGDIGNYKLSIGDTVNISTSVLRLKNTGLNANGFTLVDSRNNTKYNIDSNGINTTVIGLNIGQNVTGASWIGTASSSAYAYFNTGSNSADYQSSSNTGYTGYALALGTVGNGTGFGSLITAGKTVLASVTGSVLTKNTTLDDGSGNMVLTTGKEIDFGSRLVLYADAGNTVMRAGSSGYIIQNSDNTLTLSTLTAAGALTIASTMTATKYYLSALNTAPANASDTGTLGEIRIDASYIYICTATNTWKRVAIATW